MHFCVIYDVVGEHGKSVGKLLVPSDLKGDILHITNEIDEFSF